MNMVDKSLKEYDEILKINPRFVPAWLRKGEILRKLGKYEEALECYNKVLEIAPNITALYGKASVLYRLENLRKHWII